MAAAGQEDGCAVRVGGAEAGLTRALEREAVGHRDGHLAARGCAVRGRLLRPGLALLIISSGWSLLGQMADVSEVKIFEFISKAQSFKSDRLAHEISWVSWKALSPLCLPMLSFLLQGAGRPHWVVSANEEEACYLIWLLSGDNGVDVLCFPLPNPGETPTPLHSGSESAML